VDGEMNWAWNYPEQMQQAGFRFAGIIAVGMTVAMIAVAYVWDLPIHDPDGVSAAYLVMPVILLAAVLIDIVPRAVWRARRTPGRLPAALKDVGKERWGWRQARFVLAGLGTWYVTYATFRNLKSFVPSVTDRLYDNDLANLDRLLFLGHDPAVVLHDVFGTGLAAHFFSFIYVAWIAFVPVSLAIALVWTRRTGAGAWYVTAIAVDWLLGVVVYYLVPSLGPIYSSPGDFAALPHTWVTSLEADLWTDRVAVMSNPHHTDTVQTIAAFASLHVGIMVTATVMAYLLHLARPWKVIAWACLVLTVIATVYLGWHFFADTIGGAVLGSAAVWIAALGTGNHVGLRPKLRENVAQSSADRMASA
jgi:hypothetical protein